MMIESSALFPPNRKGKPTVSRLAPPHPFPRVVATQWDHIHPGLGPRDLPLVGALFIPPPTLPKAMWSGAGTHCGAPPPRTSPECE
jgi:hypothetical protein